MKKKAEGQQRCLGQKSELQITHWTTKSLNLKGSATLKHLSYITKLICARSRRNIYHMWFDVMLLNQDRRTREKPTIHSVVIAISKVRILRINWLVSDESLSSLPALHPNTQVYNCSPGRNRKLMEDGEVEASKVSHLAPEIRINLGRVSQIQAARSAACCWTGRRNDCWCRDPTASHLLSLHCTHISFMFKDSKPSSQVSYMSSEVPLQGEQQLHTTELPFSKYELLGKSH